MSLLYMKHGPELSLCLPLEAVRPFSVTISKDIQHNMAAIQGLREQIAGELISLVCSDYTYQ